MYLTLNSVIFLMHKMRYSLSLHELWLINRVNIQLSALGISVYLQNHKVSPHVLIDALAWCEM
jgi:hypothetical protein